MADFPLAKFRILYPQFVEVTDEVIEVIAEQAACYTGLYCTGCDEQGWMLLVAHLLALRAAIEGGTSTPGPVQSATIGSVSVSYQAAPTADSWTFWLNQTPYGQQFLALVSACFAGLACVGGSPERSGFRGAGGKFPGCH